jgi:hypothetical protein
MYSIKLPISQVPNGERVRKVTGSVLYLVMRNFTFSGGKIGIQSIELVPHPHTVFLVGDNGSGSIVPDTIDVCIDFTSPSNMLEWIDTHLIAHQ